MTLSEYDFRIIHIKGKENALADRMSRLLLEAMDFRRPEKQESALEIMNTITIQPGLRSVAVSSDEEARKRWEYWLADEWYALVVFLKLFGKLQGKDGGEDSLTLWRWWILKAAANQLINESDDYLLLAYIDRNGRWFWCVCASEVDKVLEWAHNCHSHYAADLMVK